MMAFVRARAAMMAAFEGGCFGHWALVWKELHCLGGALSYGLGDIETVAAIVFWGGP